MLRTRVPMLLELRVHPSSVLPRHHHINLTVASLQQEDLKDQASTNPVMVVNAAMVIRTTKDSMIMDEEESELLVASQQQAQADSTNIKMKP